MGSIDFLFQLLLPKDKKFYPLFEKQLKNLITTCETFETLLSSEVSVRIKLTDEIKILEHQGDQIKYAILNELAHDFLTPFDREDVQRLAISIDEILNILTSISKKIDLYRLDHITPEMIRLSQITTICSRELLDITIEMKDLRKIKALVGRFKKIGTLESEADQIRNIQVAKLFKEETDAIILVKNKEIISLLEESVNQCEDVADILHSIVIKYS